MTNPLTVRGLARRRGWEAVEDGVPILRDRATFYRLDLGRG
jgi:hypothetical protein